MTFFISVESVKMSTLTDVVSGEVVITVRGSDVAWEALRQLGAIEEIPTPEHINRCYRHIRIWKEYVEMFGPHRIVKLNLTQVV